MSRPLKKKNYVMSCGHFYLSVKQRSMAIVAASIISVSPVPFQQ